MGSEGRESVMMRSASKGVVLRRLVLAGVLAAGGALASAALAQQSGPPAATPAPAPAVSPAATPPAPAASTTASQCPGNPDALGTSREIAFDPVATPYVGSLQYKDTVPLQRGEVILTFDDGPLPPMSSRVLDALAHECVKATYFIVGVMAKAYPAVVQRIHDEGHTVGSHSQTHPLIFPKLKHEAGLAEIAKGFASTNAALQPVGAHTVPFFRFPGLGRTKFYEQFTRDNGIAVFSVDLVADDWMHLKPDQVYQRALDRLEARGSGILLLHDIQPATAVMLPKLLRELKKRNFKVVHLVAREGGYTGTEPIVEPAAGAQSAGAPLREKKTASVAPAAGNAVPKPAADGATAGPKEAQPQKPASAKTQAAKPQNPKPQPSKPKPERPADTASASAPQPAAAPFPFSWPRILPESSGPGR